MHIIVPACARAWVVGVLAVAGQPLMLRVRLRGGGGRGAELGCMHQRAVAGERQRGRLPGLPLFPPPACPAEGEVALQCGLARRCCCCIHYYFQLLKSFCVTFLHCMAIRPHCVAGGQEGCTAEGC